MVLSFTLIGSSLAFLASIAITMIVHSCFSLPLDWTLPGADIRWRALPQILWCVAQCQEQGQTSVDGSGKEMDEKGKGPYAQSGMTGFVLKENQIH